jgi:flagellar hook-basal body complex protein FliE
MANLTVEKLNSIVQSGDIEKLFSGSQNSVAQERQISPEFQSAGGSAQTANSSGKTFSDILTQSVDKVNELQTQADTAVKELVAGRTKNIHETMLALERADTSLKLMMQVRNKIIDAYKEIMRMQI